MGTSGVEMFASFGLLCLAGATLAAPLLDTPEVVEAKEQFIAAFETAREGKHAALAPVNNDIQAAQIANAYLDDTAPVSEAKLNFKIAFDTAEAVVSCTCKPSLLLTFTLQRLRKFLKL